MNLKDKIKEVKYHRMSPKERYIYDIVSGLVVYKHKDFSRFFYYKYNDKIIFGYDSMGKKLWYSYEIRDNFHRKFGQDGFQFWDLLKHIMQDYLSVDGIKLETNRGTFNSKINEKLVKI